MEQNTTVACVVKTVGLLLVSTLGVTLYMYVEDDSGVVVGCLSSFCGTCVNDRRSRVSQLIIDLFDPKSGFENSNAETAQGTTVPSKSVDLKHVVVVVVATKKQRNRTKDSFIPLQQRPKILKLESNAKRQLLHPSIHPFMNASSLTSSKLVVTVTPVNELVHGFQSDPAVRKGGGGGTGCSSNSLYTPHREYKIQITEEAGDSSDHFDGSKSNIVNPSANARIAEAGSLHTNTQLRFSKFYQHFSQYPMQHLTRTSQRLLPPKGAIWEDYTHSIQKVSDRARRMQIFLWDVLNSNGPAILRSHLLQEALSLSPADMRRLLLIAQRREQEDDVAYEQSQARMHAHARTIHEAQRKTNEEEQQLWDLAQTLNVTNPETRTSLRFQPNQQPMQFALYRKWFSVGGDENILGGRGDNQKPWFKLERTDFPIIVPFSDLTYQLRTMKGVPLLEMKERFRMMDYCCDLYYVASNQEKIHALTVQRRFQIGGFAGDRFDVTGRGPLAKKQFICQGPWRQETIHIDGMFAGRLDQHFFSLSHGHTLTVAPNQDCLLLLGIACAVVRIHAARED